MSKAFSRENDSDSEDDNLYEKTAVKFSPKVNYITPAGQKKLAGELHQLLRVERPKVTEMVAWAASNGDRSENADYQYGKRRLREIDRRATFLSRRLADIKVVDPAVNRGDEIFFGATVTLLYEDDSQRVFSIVGTDEVNVGKGRISWVSPLGAALLKARQGQVVTFRSPKGEQEVEVIKVEYKALE